MWWMIRSVTDELLSWHYRRRRYREDAKGRWWDSRENLQVWSVASYRSWDVYRAWILHRSGFDDVVQVPGGGGGRSGKQGWCRLLSRGTPEPPFSVTRRPRPLPWESVWKRARTLSVSSTSAKLHDLGVLSAPKLFPANRKNSPTSPAFPPQGSHGFLHRYIFSVNAPRGSLFQPHHEYTELSLIRYVKCDIKFFNATTIVI